jgi:CheY-like chemotaxis protein
MMPGMDGLQAVALIRELEHSLNTPGRTPVVALTANVISGQKDMFLQSGMDDFLAKPIEMQKLYGILRKWLPEEKWVSGTPKEDGTERARFDDFVVEGVDVAAGIKNAGGSARIYRDLLEEFCRSSSGLTIQIRKAMEQEDYVLYTTIVHGIKSALRIIGAEALGNCAASLEISGNRKDASTIRENTGMLLEGIDTLTKHIGDAFARDAAKVEERGSAVLSGSQLEAIKTALIDMDIATVNELLMECMGSALNDDARSKLLEIENDILLFEYESAIAKIDALL